MAASLDEIQDSELFQHALEYYVELYLKELHFKKNILIRYELNAFIEFACFNKLLEHTDQISEAILEDFETWYEVYSNGANSPQENILKFLSYLKIKNLKV